MIPRIQTLVVLCTLQMAAVSLPAVELLPPAHELFAPLRADPRELQYALRLVTPVHRQVFGDTSIGDYLGLLRWNVGDVPVQINGGGGVFARFDLESRTNDMQVADFYANFPVDVRKGPWSGRLLLYHTSSHLGDDFIARTGQRTEKHTWDVLRMMAAFEPSSRSRVYAGYSYTFRVLPGGYGRSAFQSGLELTTRWFGEDHIQGYWATDFQAWQRTKWNPMLNTQAGLTFARDPVTRRSLSLFVEFSAGRLPQGQFFLKKETRWSTGVRFTLC